MKHSTRLIPLNADGDGCAVTLTTAHHFAGNIVSPRQGFREMGAIVITDMDEHGLWWHGRFVTEGSSVLLNTYGSYNRGGLRDLSRTIKSEKMDTGVCVRHETIKTMSKERDFHKQVRVVYRALRKIYGTEKTQDEALRIFKVVFPHLNEVRKSEESEFHIPQEVIDGIKAIRDKWKPSGELARLFDKSFDMMEMPIPWKKDALIKFYEDILPVVMRIRKLTPYETGILMDLRREEVQKMYDAGLSNSAIYKLHGNSITANTLYYIFKKMFIDTKPEIKTGEPIQLSLF